MKRQSIKLYDGFSTVFRQHSAAGTHCSFLHGYAVSFEVTFEGELDNRNWIFDFGGMKRAKTQIDGKNPKDWMDYMFDHTTIISESDPALPLMEKLDHVGVVQLRILPEVGAERFAEYVFFKLNKFVETETEGRVSVTRVEFKENGKNSAVYSR